MNAMNLDNIKEALESGQFASQAEIARHFGVSRQLINFYIKKNNIKPKIFIKGGE